MDLCLCGCVYVDRPVYVCLRVSVSVSLCVCVCVVVDGAGWSRAGGTSSDGPVRL